MMSKLAKLYRNALWISVLVPLIALLAICCGKEAPAGKDEPPAPATVKTQAPATVKTPPPAAPPARPIAAPANQRLQEPDALTSEQKRTLKNETLKEMEKITPAKLEAAAKKLEEEIKSDLAQLK